MIQVEQVRHRRVEALSQINFEFCHEPGRGQPEVISDQQQALHMSTVTLSQRLRQFDAGIDFTGMEPLFKLVDDQQDLGAGCQTGVTPKSRQGCGEGRMVSDLGHAPGERMQKS